MPFMLVPYRNAIVCFRSLEICSSNNFAFENDSKPKLNLMFFKFKFPTISCVRQGIRRKTLPNLLCGCLKTSAVATPDKWEQPKEEEEDSLFKFKKLFEGFICFCF